MLERDMKITPEQQKKKLLYPLASVAAAGCVALASCQQQQQQQRLGGKPLQPLGGVIMIEPSKDAPEVKAEQK